MSSFRLNPDRDWGDLQVVPPPLVLPIPKRGRKLRWLMLGCGAAVFLWSSAEDNRVFPAVLLSLVCSGTLVVWWMMGIFGGKRLSTRQALLLIPALGGLIGASTSLITAALMLLKNVRHAHLFPDYPLGLMGGVIERAPSWAAAGALIGLGVWALWRSSPTKG